MGLCRIIVKKCLDKILVEVFLKSDKVIYRIIFKIYKKSLKVYENLDENMLRSIVVYYSGVVMGK